MKKMTVASGILAALILAGTVGQTVHITASANSAPPYWEGTTGTGAIVTGEQCPIEVERERLTLNIPTLPQTSYASPEEFSLYTANVKAEYTFYNPTDMDVEMTLAFPFGRRPEYSNAYYDGDAGLTYYDDTARYEITADGDTIQRELRHTYQYYSFNVSSMYSMADEKKEDDFFKCDTPVAQYHYTVSLPKNVDSGIAEFELQYNPTRTKILCRHYRAEEVVNGNLHLFLYADKENNATLSFTAVGETPVILSTAVKKGGYTWESETWKEIEGASVDKQSVTEMTFSQYVDASRPAGISEVDFYNGFYELLISYVNSSYYGARSFFNVEPKQLSMSDFMRWYTYKLTIPAGQRLKNSVTAPLYPTINNQKCEYEYLLSPAQKWADFGELDIIINTEFEISDASLEFIKTESGYSLHREGLPLGELTFTIGGNYKYPRSAWNIAIIVIMVIIFVVVGSIVVAGITVGIVFGVKRSKKKKQNK